MSTVSCISFDYNVVFSFRRLQQSIAVILVSQFNFVYTITNSQTETLHNMNIFITFIPRTSQATRAVA
jgi:hypothetical protein